MGFQAMLATVIVLAVTPVFVLIALDGTFLPTTTVPGTVTAAPAVACPASTVAPTTSTVMARPAAPNRRRQVGPGSLGPRVLHRGVFDIAPPFARLVRRLLHGYCRVLAALTPPLTHSIRP